MIIFYGRSNSYIELSDQQFGEVIRQIRLHDRGAVPVVFVLQAFQQLARHVDDCSAQLGVQSTKQVRKQVGEQFR